MANDAPDMELKFEGFEPAEVRREAPETTELHGPHDATSTTPTPARGGDDGIEVLTPRGDPPEMELDVVGGDAKDRRCKDPQLAEDCGGLRKYGAVGCACGGL